MLYVVSTKGKFLLDEMVRESVRRGHVLSAMEVRCCKILPEPEEYAIHYGTFEQAQSLARKFFARIQDEKCPETEVVEQKGNRTIVIPQRQLPMAARRAEEKLQKEIAAIQGDRPSSALLLLELAEFVVANFKMPSEDSILPHRYEEYRDVLGGGIIARRKSWRRRF